MLKIIYTNLVMLNILMCNFHINGIKKKFTNNISVHDLQFKFLVFQQIVAKDTLIINVTDHRKNKIKKLLKLK